MVDLHCHILPGVDDGAGSLDDALKMAHLAAVSGVKAIVATPHCNLPGGEEDNYSSPAMKKRFEEFDRAVQETGIPLRILPGAEVFCTPQLPQLLQGKKLQTLAGSKYLLMEFYFDESPEFMEACFADAVRLGYTPVVAHPERYEAVYRAPDLVLRWFRQGYIIQLNKGSILGRLGRHAETASRFLLQQGLAHVVASDAHSPRQRTPYMGEIVRHLEDAYAPAYARILLSRNPERIIQNRDIIKP